MAELNNGFIDEFVETQVLNRRHLIPGRKYLLRRRSTLLRDGRLAQPEEKSLFEFDELILKFVSLSPNGLGFTYKNPEFSRKIHVEYFLGNNAVPATSTPVSEWQPLPKEEEPNDITLQGLSTYLRFRTPTFTTLMVSVKAKKTGPA